MTLIKSISGIRGTIGGKAGDGLSPIDVVKFTAAYAMWIKDRNAISGKKTIVVGRDARISGEMVLNMVTGTLTGLGFDVVNIGLATTPTTEMAVTDLNASGGLIITASHNPAQWNALKLLNEKGEFLNASDGEQILEMADSPEWFASIEFAEVNDIGRIIIDDSQLEKHIEKIIDLKYVDVDAIRNANLKVAFDCVNSVGGIAIPQLLTLLGVKNQVPLYVEPTGVFPRNPEPLPENLTEISKLVVEQKADLAFVVDPDVDRLAIVNEDGSMFGEEYTLVSVADYVLSINKGNTVSNLSSTRALRDITVNHNGSYSASAVGEVNVVDLMKETNAIIGGEGNGGVILPELHYGRDALLGIALFLTQLVKSEKKCLELRNDYPNYFMAKKKVELKSDKNLDSILLKIKKKYSDENILDVDGIKIDFPDSWVHMRKSNTEPIIRVYAEADSEQAADKLANKFIEEIQQG